MRWKQKIVYERSPFGTQLEFMRTYETVAPFRSFKQLVSRGYWVLPIGIDKLVETMEKARVDKNWEVADTIRKSLTDGDIVVRNGKDWYPKFIEVDVNAEKDFTSWLYSTLVGSGKTKAEAKEIKDHFDSLAKETYNI